MPALDVIVEAVDRRARSTLQPSLRPAINATGVIIHTNLGRAPLSDEALAAMTAAARGYSNLEFDLEAGERGSRHVNREEQLRRLTGAEAALAVARGEPPSRFTSPVDDINEEVVAKSAGMNLAQLVSELKSAHGTLVQAIRDLPDPDAVLMLRHDGSSPTAKDRLRTIAHHWTEHLEELLAADG